MPQKLMSGTRVSSRANGNAKFFLASYRPLVHNRVGRDAVQKYGHPPFIDGSCRREPDLESRSPSITAICRCGMFAPRLRVGDRVIYMTRKHASERGVRQVVAALEVVHRFDTHQQAASWYVQQALPLPSNCMVRQNPPWALDHTDHGDGKETDVYRWDLKYHSRARRHPVFLVCRPLAVQLWTTPAITDADLVQIFGRVPGTQTPPTIEPCEFESLLALLVRANDNPILA